MGILQKIKLWFETDAETTADETPAETGDATPTETDNEPSLDPDGARETRIESDETVPGELNRASEPSDADDSPSK